MKEKNRITGNELIQQRAVQSREKLLQSALSTYAEKGYHDSTVDEIAKRAGLSVGTAYRYFKDKKELLLASLEYSFSRIKEIVNVSETAITDGSLEKSLIKFEAFHKKYYDLHEELEGLRHTDRDVARLYNEFTDTALRNLYEKLPENVKVHPFALERLRIAVGIMENHCHFYMNSKPNKASLDYMRKCTVELVNGLFRSFPP